MEFVRKLTFNNIDASQLKKLYFHLVRGHILQYVTTNNLSHHTLKNDKNRKCVRIVQWNVQVQKLVHLTSCLHVPTKYVASSSLLPSLSLDSKGTGTVVPCRTHTSCVAINFFYVGNLAHTLGIHTTLSLLSEQ